MEKRTFDLLLSFVGLIFLAPFFLISYPFFLLTIGYPVIFKQQRMGKDKKPFTIYKIRTMKIGSESKRKKLEKINIAPYPMFKAINDPRFNKIGKILSRFGIDELPQLINIIKGEMSFVGPRPLPVNEAKLLDTSWDFRYEVKPGILSEWALSEDRYKSLKDWKRLETHTIKNGFVEQDFKLILKAINQIILKKII